MLMRNNISNCLAHNMLRETLEFHSNWLKVEVTDVGVKEKVFSHLARGKVLL